MLEYILIGLGLISFFIGYFFLAKSQGENECIDPKVDMIKNPNYIGGVVGVVFGLFCLVIGFILMSTGATKTAETQLGLRKYP